MGLVWVKLWKQTEVSGQGCLSCCSAAGSLQFGHDAQWAELLSWRSTMGRSKAG